MDNKQTNVNNFNGRLWLSGGRDSVPTGGMRRCVNAAPELTGSVYSRFGSKFLYPIAAISLTKFDDSRYQYDGTSLYKDGSQIATGFNGGRLAFVKMPPQIGDPDYLFITGGGKVIKLDSLGNITNWGIQNEAAISMTANNIVPTTMTDLIVIDTFDTDSGNWTAVNTTKADEATIIAVVNPNDAGGSLKLNPSGNWNIINTFSSTAQNWGYYPSGDLSLQTDVFQFWFYFDTFGGSATAANTSAATWLEFDIDVNDGSFKKDFYTVIMGMIPAGSTNPVVKKNTNLSVRFNTGQWQQITLPKSIFNRTGTNLQFDYTCVQAIRFAGGNFVGNLYLDYLTLMGGTEMGAGPAVGNGGSEYDYYTTFLNLTTGSESNPQNAPAKVFQVQVNKVALSQIPISSDPQVSARNIYRSSAQNTFSQTYPAFYLDTIYDNSTTTYTDSIADFSVPLIQTLWKASTAVPPANIASGASYYIDAGNGYYFKLTGSGTTGASPPNWVIPTNVWAPQTVQVVGETLAPFYAAGKFWQCTTAGTTGLLQPNWAASSSPGDTITDGTVVWTNIGTQATTDNGVVWTFQGINSTQVLGNQQLLFDNLPPQPTYNDAVGPFQGCAFWCRDTTPGRLGAVYFSPAGRPESVEDFVIITSDDDPTQKLVIWDENLYCITTKKVYPIVPITTTDASGNATTTFAAGSPILGARGTSNPFSVVSTTSGVVYQGPDGPRYFTNGGNGLLAFDALAPIFRGQAQENVQPFKAVIACQTRGEILFSDTTAQTFGLINPLEQFLALPVWRMVGMPFTAMNYESDNDAIIAAWGGNTYNYERVGPGAPLYADNGTPIAIEWQSPSVLVNEGQYALVQRVYLYINCNGQVLTPTLLVDEDLTPNSYAMPNITNTTRGVIEINFQKHAKLLGIRLTGNVSARVEWFGMSLDLRPSSP